MLFNSIEFAFFFPIVTILFFMLQHKYRWMLLLASSCFFYMFFKPEYILILAFIIVIDYYAAIWMEKQDTYQKKKLLLILSLVANVGVLIVFKYYNFLAININSVFSFMHIEGSLPLMQLILPIGLSFHTLQAMSYTIEVSRGSYKAEKHFGIYALYVMFYPQLVAGPIERPQNLIPQFYQKKVFSTENAKRGLMLIAWGLFKKVVIADRLALFVNQVHSMPDGYYTGIPLIIAYLAFPFQIYCDFSGYSDIAIGCAKTMGYDLTLNFKKPMVSKNINIYWSSWHISLTSWFRDYLYLPLRRKFLRNGGIALSVFAVFMLSGLWHGANWTFIVWGALNAFLLIVYNVFKHKKFFVWITSRMSDKLAYFITASSVFATCVFFRSSSVTKAVHYLQNMFKNVGHQCKQIITNEHSARLNLLYIKQSGSNFLLSILFVIGLLVVESKFVNNSIYDWLYSKNKIYRWSFYYLLLFIFIMFGIFTKSEFIYFQF